MAEQIERPVGMNKSMRLSAEAFCLAQRAVERLPRAGRQVVTVETCIRKVKVRSLVTVVAVQPYGCAETYLADVVTGSLYQAKGGRCLTSSARRIVRRGA